MSNKNSLSKIKQSYAGYLNTTVPEGGWGAYWENPAAPSVHDWTFPETARKYEIGGTSNYAGAIALGESLGLVNEIGIENIQRTRLGAR
ncbi:MAG: aminotransferase class V-fold PLP-dependent enzyme [Flavonifractor plautii]